MNTNPTVYLDIDGVLNGHQKHPNGYCGTDPACVARFNELLRAEPRLQIVISSAWRYLILNHSMTPGGFECLLLTHGVACVGRVAGHTDADERFLPPKPSPAAYADLTVRSRLIDAHARENNITCYAVLDDLAIPHPRLIRTVGARGLQDCDVADVLVALAGQGERRRPPPPPAPSAPGSAIAHRRRRR